MVSRSLPFSCGSEISCYVRCRALVIAILSFLTSPANAAPTDQGPSSLALGIPTISGAALGSLQADWRARARLQGDLKPWAVSVAAAEKAPGIRLPVDGPDVNATPKLWDASIARYRKDIKIYCHAPSPAIAAWGYSRAPRCFLSV
jgi:hypothetical protein